MSNIIDIRDYNIKTSDKFFIDNNILIYLFCPTTSYNKDIVDEYSKFFTEMIKSKCEIYISSLILSEFFNTYTRIEFQRKKDNNKKLYNNFKLDFRNTKEYKELSNKIIQIINKQILPFCKKLDDNFNNIDFNFILQPNNNFDFNDRYISKLCIDNNLKLITNDKDFKNIKENITILTYNR